MTQDSGLRTQDSGLRTNYDRDKEYWNEYYSSLTTQNAISEPSNFAISISGQLERNKSILDVGCGNGRDSLHFMNLGLNVTGIDASDKTIEKLRKIQQENKFINFICGDFVNNEEIYSRKYDYIYSRFTLHAITSQQQNEFLKNTTNILVPNGKIFIEARTLRDDLYNMGEKLGDNAFIYDGHYRRFIEPEELADIMRSLGYEIIYLCESRGFSKFGDSDPVLMRLIAKI